MKRYLLIVGMLLCCFLITCKSTEQISKESKIMYTDERIIKVYRQEVPALRFIGKKYGNNDRVNGMFGKHWGDWYENGWFGIIENLIDFNMNTLFENGNDNIGLMRDNNGEFEYWIGKFMPENTIVPEGFNYYDFPKGAFAITWLYDYESKIFGLEGMVGENLNKLGYEVIVCKENSIWAFERYTNRFGTPDEKGKIILDIGFFIK